MAQPAGQRVRPRGERDDARSTASREAVSVTRAAGDGASGDRASGEAGTAAHPAQAGAAGSGGSRQARRKPRRARVYVTRLDPWSVAKAAFLLALAIGIVIVVAVAVVFWTLDSTGALDSLSRTVDDVLGTGGFDLLTTLEFSRVLGLAAVIASVEIVLVSALATLFAFLYNISVGLTGGIEVVLSDD